MKERQEILQQAKDQDFDLVVVGAGLAGAGIAQNAASRGLSVLVLEKSDFASGASGRGSQLIHGDLPYLEQVRFNLSRQMSEEKERLQRLAPHLIQDLPFVLPLIRNNLFFNLKATVGLGLYDVLTMAAAHGNAHAYLNRKKLANLVPSFSEELVSGGIQFQDAITDDARLVLAVLKSATSFGATVLNYVQASGFRLESGKINGVHCHDRYSGEEFIVSCKVCINAAGAWSAEVQKLIDQNANSASPTKATQIVVPASAFETNSALLLPAKDGRFVFVLPWHYALLIGSAESTYAGALDEPRSNRDEIDYLLSVVNSYADGSQQLNVSDVISAFAGVKAQLGNTLSGSSPEASKSDGNYAIQQTTGGLINVVGARPGNYRLIAQATLEKAGARQPDLLAKQAKTESTMLGGWLNKEHFLAESAAIEIKARRLKIDPASIQHLIANYGSEAEHVVDLVENQASLSERIIADYPVIMAEIPFAALNEMAVSLQDFMLRRSRLGLLNRAEALASAPRVAELMAQTLGWDDYRSKVELSALRQLISDRQEEVDAIGI